jgi:hypothetical protein
VYLQLDVRERTLDASRRWRLDLLARRPRRTSKDGGRWEVKRGVQRERRPIVILDLLMIAGVMLQDAVELHVTMDDHVHVTLLLGFMHVFGRSDGQQCHRGPEHAGQSPGHPHKVDTSRQTPEATNEGS